MKNALMALMGLFAVVAGIFAYRSQQELAALRASAETAAMREAALQTEKAKLQKAEEETQQRAAGLEKELAAERARLVAAQNLSTRDSTAVPNAASGPADFLSSAMSILDNPEMQRSLAARQRSTLNARYGPLFKNLHLDAATLTQFKDLLVEKQMVSSDVLSVVAKQGLNPLQNRQEVSQLLVKAQSDIDGKIKTLLGDEGYGQFQNYQRTQPQRAVVTQLEQNLSYTDAPLTAAQSEQLVQILASTANTGARSQTTPVPTRATARISDEMIDRAGAVLSPTQLQALEDIRQQQQEAQRAALLLLQNQAARPAAKENPPVPAPSPTSK